MDPGVTSAGPVVCFGEILLRLGAPDGELLLQSPKLHVSVAGAEANVAVGLARLGHAARMVSVLPANALGHAALGELRRWGVETGGVSFAPGRMGLYFLTHRAAACAPPTSPMTAPARPSPAPSRRASTGTPPSPAPAGCTSPASPRRLLRPTALTAALRAVAAAEPAGRAGLAFELATTAAKALGRVAGRRTRHSAHAPRRRRPRLHQRPGSGPCRWAAASTPPIPAARAPGRRPPPPRSRPFPASSAHRRHHPACAMRVGFRHGTRCRTLFARGGAPLTSRTYAMHQIVDRIGGGDAFAAGLLHGLLRGDADQTALDFAVAAAVAKHAIRGDFNLASEAEIAAIAAGEGDGRAHGSMLRLPRRGRGTAEGGGGGTLPRAAHRSNWPPPG